MTATSPVSPGRSASPGSSGSQRNPMVSRAPATGPVSPEVAWAAVASAVSAIAGALPASLAPDTLTAARIAALAGVMEVHHGWRG
jgi:hypothetical protein